MLYNDCMTAITITIATATDATSTTTNGDKWPGRAVGQDHPPGRVIHHYPQEPASQILLLGRRQWTAVRLPLWAVLYCALRHHPVHHPHTTRPSSFCLSSPLRLRLRFPCVCLRLAHQHARRPFNIATPLVSLFPLFTPLTPQYILTHDSTSSTSIEVQHCTSPLTSTAYLASHHHLVHYTHFSASSSYSPRSFLFTFSTSPLTN